ncbi:MAG TPA: hypothetical protein VFD77_07425 [Brumimicrobium sp.]|nr:hypothetical protein [Brumimicrobium sp.]
MEDTPNTNLQQALEMSLYTWAIAIFIGVLIFLIAYQLKSTTSKQNLYQFSILLLAPYTIVTGFMWFYYFTIVLCLPFFVLQLFLTWNLYRLKPSGNIVFVLVILIGLTILFSLLAAWFFGII